MSNSENIQSVLNSTLLEGEIIKWYYIKQNYILYAITSKRALIITVSRKVGVESFYYEELKIIGTVVHQNGSGDLLFKVTEIRDSEAELISIENSGFTDISDVEDVESILLKELNVIDVLEKKASDGLYEYEKITWSSTPKPRLFTFITVLKSILGFVMFTFLTLFVFGAIYIVLSNKDKQLPIAMIGAIMLIAGVGLMIVAVKLMLSPVSLLLKDKKISYIITNTRALIVKKEKSNKYLTILPEKINMTQTNSNNLILMSDEYYDFDKQYYMDGLGFYRISNANEAIKWITPLLKTQSNQELVSDNKLEMSNIRMNRKTSLFVAVLCLGFSIFFLVQMILGIIKSFEFIREGVSTFELYLTFTLSLVFGCGMYLVGFIITGYLAYLFYKKVKD